MTCQVKLRYWKLKHQVKLRYWKSKCQVRLRCWVLKRQGKCWKELRCWVNCTHWRDTDVNMALLCVSLPLWAAVWSNWSIWAAVTFFSCDTFFTTAAPPTVTFATKRTWRERNKLRCRTLAMKLNSCAFKWASVLRKRMLWLLTTGIAVAGCAAQSRPLQVEAVLAALTVAALKVSRTVDTVQAPGVPEAVSRSSIAFATQSSCMKKRL